MKIGENITAKINANTKDIVNALINISESAYKRDSKIFATIGNDLESIFKMADYILSVVTYVKDGYENQNIKLPARLFKTKTGDCKSLALSMHVYLKKSNINNGYTFAAYKNNNNPTHVYNWFMLNGKKEYIDLCTKDNLENKNFTKKIDMNINYLGAANNEYIGDRAERRKRRKEFGRGTNIKKIALALPRNAFITLISLNFRGLASKVTKLQQKNPNALRKFWGKLGGDPEKLIAAARKGAAKKAFFGSKGVNGQIDKDIFYVGEPITAATAFATAAPIVLAVLKLFSKEKVSEVEDDMYLKDLEQTTTAISPDGSDFEASDPENSFNFMPSTPVLIGGAALLLLLLKK